MKFIKKYTTLHSLDTQLQIRDENRHKAGIYMILNTINNSKYIGAAITNRISVRFRSHCINGSGSKLVRLAILKYGLENFEFYILEYYPGIILKNNLNHDHLKLLNLETEYIKLLKPEYNILQQGTSTLGYTHTEDTKRQLKNNYSQDRKIAVGLMAKNMIFTPERRQLLSSISKLRNQNTALKEKLSKLASKPVTLYNKDGSVHSTYSGIRVMAKAFNCCNKTINKAIKNHTIFRDIGVIKIDQKVS